MARVMASNETGQEKSTPSAFRSFKVGGLYFFLSSCMPLAGEYQWQHGFGNLKLGQPEVVKHQNVPSWTSGSTKLGRQAKRFGFLSYSSRIPVPAIQCGWAAARLEGRSSSGV
eukprot:CAMPEP_0174904976 /NCGR_PEP_ID=MMETSP0167-20121228/50955_1 /TAXON_ID=38298 /ORGANISM="Rhodella maculata, Strain CCMP736" /LENGTH=112 /DNA_ID=CAMNT_0016147775 /DNA_START=160 /DNA_END=498 /DNA_ORIENTATION=+